MSRSERAIVRDSVATDWPTLTGLVMIDEWDTGRTGTIVPDRGVVSDREEVPLPPELARTGDPMLFAGRSIWADERDEADGPATTAEVVIERAGVPASLPIVGEAGGGGTSSRSGRGDETFVIAVIAAAEATIPAERPDWMARVPMDRTGAVSFVPIEVTRMTACLAVEEMRVPAAEELPLPVAVEPTAAVVRVTVDVTGATTCFTGAEICEPV